MRRLGVKSGFPLYVVDRIGEGNVILQAGDAQNELVSLQGKRDWTGCLMELTIRLIYAPKSQGLE